MNVELLAVRVQAYRKLALAKHPDRGGDPEEFARLSKAYEVGYSDGKASTPSHL